MRRAFVSALVSAAEADSRIVLLTGDLGFTVLEPFAERFPERFFNAGVAEQNMVGMATGLAEAGYVPFTYSIATFASLRPYEFVRNGPVLHELPVRVVGVGGGLDYGHNGPSHYALEDLAVMRAQPGLAVVAPADWQQAQAAVHALARSSAPAYLRLGRDEVHTVPGLDGRFDLGGLARVSDGTDLVVVATGGAAVEAAGAVERLAAAGVDAGFAVCASIAPAPVDELLILLSAVPVVLTVEDHYVTGGLGSLVAELVADAGVACRVVRCGIGDAADGLSGSSPYLNRVHGLDAASLAAAAAGALADARAVARD